MNGNKRNSSEDNGTGSNGEPESGLSKVEEQELSRLEETIKKGFTAFVEVGQAFAVIRDSHLYRGKYHNFENYCRKEWDLSRPRAYQLMAGAAVVENLSTKVERSRLPDHETLVRPLTKLKDPMQQLEMWKRAEGLAIEQGCAVTARMVEEVVADFVGPKEHPKKHNGFDQRRLLSGIMQRIDRAFEEEDFEAGRAAFEELKATLKMNG